MTNKKIVIIDDEPDVLEIIQAVLNTKGYTSLAAESGEEGLELVEKEMPDLIITDLMMPKVSGLEVLKRLARNEKCANIPVIVLSALTTDSEKPAEFWIKSLGVADYLTKPFDPLDLLGRVEFIFRRSAYRSSGSVNTSAVKTPNPDETKLKLNYATATPREIVKTFVESWNNGDFADEFHCLSEEMVGGLELRAYVSRRRAARREEGEQPHHQRIAGFLEEKLSGSMCKVVIEREEIRENRRTWRKKEIYMLRRTASGWKIVSVKPYKAMSGETG